MATEQPKPPEQEPIHPEVSAPLEDTLDALEDANSGLPMENDSDVDIAIESDIEPSIPESIAPDQSTASTPPPPPAAPRAPQPSPTPVPGRSSDRRQALLQMGRQLWDIWLAVLPILVGLSRQLWQLTLNLLKWIRETWTLLLPKIRPLLPEPLKTKLPDQAVTAIAIGLLLLMLWITSALSPTKAPAVPAKDFPIPPEVSAPAKPAAPVIVAPDPDQLANIQDQLVEISDRYGTNFVRSIQADFRHNRLIVTVARNWYTLEPSQQDQLANDWLKRSHKLKFDRLELTDAIGTLAARSPVVGSNMVVLQRSAPPGLPLEPEPIESEPLLEESAPSLPLNEATETP